MKSDVIRIAICDDEKVIAEKIKKYVEDYINKTELPYIIDIYRSGEEFILLKNAMTEYDIVFLDVSMKEIDGIKTAYELRKYSDNTYIVFVTGFIQYSLAGYKVNAIRYIIKDNDTIKSDIEEALDTIFEKLGKRSDEVIYDFVEEKSKKVMISNIVYIESSLHRISFHVYEDGRDKIYTIYKKMDDIEIEFKAEELVRVHQSFIVNMRYVCDIKRYCVKLINSIEIPVSKQRYKNAILEYARQKGEI